MVPNYSIRPARVAGFSTVLINLVNFCIFSLKTFKIYMLLAGIEGILSYIIDTLLVTIN